MVNISFNHSIILKLILVCYASIFYIGEFDTMDRLAPQNFVLSILNTLVVVYGLYNFRNKKVKRFKFFYGLLNVKSVSFYYTLIFISMIVSLSFTLNLIESIVSLTHYYNVILSFFCLSFILNKFEQIKFFLFGLIVLIFITETVYVFFSIIDYYFTYDVFGNWGRTFEIRGFTGNINITAFSLCYKLPFVIYFISKNFNKRLLVFFFSILLIITIINIFHLASRGGILSMGFVLLTSVLYYFSKFKSLSVLILILCLAGFTISYVTLKDSRMANPIKRSSTISVNTKDGSINQRLRYYSEVLNYVKKNPLLPIGVGNYKLKSIEFEKDEIRQYIVPLHTHNDFLEILIENGLIAFLAYVLIFLVLFKSVLKQLILFKNISYLPLLLFLCVYSLDSLINFPIARPISFIFFNLITAFIINDSEK